jgi:sec-independent protein translocase protein TatB
LFGAKRLPDMARAVGQSARIFKGEMKGAAAWLARTLRQIKDYTYDANQKIRSELGPEFDEIRAPLDDLRSELGGLRTWRNPRTALLRHLGDDPITPFRYPPPLGDWEPTPYQQPDSSPPTLAAGERPPIDPEAT